MLFAALGCGAAPRSQEPPEARSPFESTIRPLIGRYCLECHATAERKGDVDLERWSTLAIASADPLLLQDVVVDQLSDRAMPPEDAEQPTDEERALLLGFARDSLAELAQAMAGDPGPVVLRRLSNAEYGNCVRDLTGVPELDPAREFPADGAAGEGFTNVGQALVMSPALLEKYFDAAKRIAEHAVLVPGGIRFSPHATRRDWTEELLTAIRGFYRRYTEPGGGEVVNLQGIVFATNSGGRIPLEPYLFATLELRDAAEPAVEIERVARTHHLSARYLRTLLATLGSDHGSPLLDPIRAAWRSATPTSIAAVVAAIEARQAWCFEFNTVGHLGKVGGPTSWLEGIEPWSEHREVTLAIGAGDADGFVHLELDARAVDADSNGRTLVWDDPHFVIPGRPELPLREVGALSAARRDSVARCCAAVGAACAAAEELIGDAADTLDVQSLAARHGLDADTLAAWLSCLGIAKAVPLNAEACFNARLPAPANAPFVTGFGEPELPAVVANPSAEPVRIPGDLPAHGVAVHPSPSRTAAVGWRSPIDGRVDVQAAVHHAHAACGNGVIWSLELRRGAVRRVLASGAVPRGGTAPAIALDALAIRSDDFVVLAIGAGAGDHSCDLTAIDLSVTATRVATPSWHLAAECAPDLLAGNPHPDASGRAGVWYFFGEPDPQQQGAGLEVPDGSALARWRAASDPDARARAADELAALLAGSGSPNAADLELRRRLVSLTGPLGTAAIAAPALGAARSEQLGTVPDAAPPEPTVLACTVPAKLAFDLPAELVAGATFVTSTHVEGPDGIVAVEVRAGSTAAPTGSPLVIADSETARARAAAASEEFRAVFPAALCYPTIVPVDEVITLTQFYREDEPLRRLILDDAATAELDRLWDELHFVSQDALTAVDAFEQLWQYATQDADPSVFEPLRAPIAARATEFRARLAAVQRLHLAAVEEFATRAYRRPLRDDEREGFAQLYAALRAEGLEHDAAIRLIIARVLVSPSFLYRAETPPAGTEPAPVDAHELATRLSFFLTSSMPDAELRVHADDGSLCERDVLIAQTRRLLRGPSVRRFAIEFGCTWLHVRDFDQNADKSETVFPTFAGLRASMYEETIRFLTDLVQNDGSVLALLDADYTFVDPALAAHYGVPAGPTEGWSRVDGMHGLGRTGILTHASILASQSGASRTSPILRGNWVAEVLLGDKLPRPPKGVPRLPEDEAGAEWSVRELTELHSRDPRCAHCHQRIDAFGFALEAFDGIGRARNVDLGGRPIDTTATAMDGAVLDGVMGLRDYLLTARRDAFVHQFCRKLLGYGLGRAVRLSDEPLLALLGQQLAADEFRIGRVFETIVTSPQFTMIRGRDAPDWR